MSLRCRPTTAFFVQCDVCGVETPIALMPVAAEVAAEQAGWGSSPGLSTHVCPWCVEHGRGDFLPAVPGPPNTATPTAGR